MKPAHITLLAVFSLTVTASAADWPQWRGVNRDGVWSEADIIERIPEQGLAVRWSAKVSNGYSAPSVAAGRVFITDHVTEPELERVLCFDEATGKMIESIAAHEDEMRAIACSPDGKLIASGSGDETIKLWRTADAKETATLKGHRSAITSIAFAPDARTLATAEMDDAVRVWELPNAK